MRFPILFLAFPATLALFAFGAGSRQAPPPTFNNDIGTIIYDNCTSCHRPNGAAPIPLTSFEEVRRNAELIRIQTLTQAMPPCPIQSDVAEFCTVKPLTEDALLKLQRWIQAGMPEGDGPAPKPSLPPITWAMGKPDIVIQLGNGLKTRPEGTRYWQVYVVDIPKNASLISGFEILPDKPFSLQNVTIGIAPSGTKLPKSPYETAGSLDAVGSNWIGVWSPGTAPWRLPEGLAKKLPSGGKLLVQAHYQPTGKSESAGFKLGLKLAPATARPTDWITFDKKKFIIEAEASPDLAFDYTVPRDVRFIALAPEARFFATRIRLLATFPSCGTKMIFENYRWNPYYIGNWVAKMPIDLPKGTKLKAILSYANDESCSMNENKKPERVFSGPRIENEVCRMHLLFAPKL